MIHNAIRNRMILKRRYRRFFVINGNTNSKKAKFTAIIYMALHVSFKDLTANVSG
jgi:hypothetical protein